MLTTLPAVSEGDGQPALGDLFQAQGGLFSSVARIGAQGGEPRLVTRIAVLGDLAQVGVAMKPRREDAPATTLAGAGTGLYEAEGLRPALAEGIERYCSSVYAADQFVWASADELGAEALDLGTIARCSPAELEHPLCPLRAPDKKAPMRWVRSVSLLDGRLVYVPAVMVYLYAGVAGAGERIWHPITTGCAAYPTYEGALARAILEIVERDAISIVWLQRLPLARIEIDEVAPCLAGCWERYQQSSRDLEYVFFDATADLGLPTVYALQVARADPRVSTLVACSTEMTAPAAVAKVIRDMAAARISLRHPRPVPESWDEFSDVFHGATYMARRERAEAFQFLLESGRTRRLSEMPAAGESDGQGSLAALLGRLRQGGFTAYAVDLSTDEALRCGMRVVRVIIPGLQPLSFHYRARYLGHPRLYEAPRFMGLPVHPEEGLNQWPQPFA
jgi:ribosomal protein S12 methylthiotransferase accessory factor